MSSEITAYSINCHTSHALLGRERGRGRRRRRETRGREREEEQKLLLTRAVINAIAHPNTKDPKNMPINSPTDLNSEVNSNFGFSSKLYSSTDLGKG